MSIKYTVSTSMTNKEVAKHALDLADIAFTEKGNNLYLNTGVYVGTVIHTSTGVIQSGDSSVVKVKEEDIGILRQYYAEALHRKEAILQGVDIQSRSIREINGERCVILHCHMA
jgi:hypothetical protein